MIPLLVKILFVVLWCLYAAFDGIEEANLYDGIISTNKKVPQLHPYFFAKRFFFLLAVSFIIPNLWYIGGLICIFSYIHDGCYYIKRNQLNSKIYPLKWKSSSTTSTAIIEMNYLERLMLFCLGVGSLCYSFISILF